jgi:hypothetical protein
MTAEALPRPQPCCDTHDTWTELCEHLVKRFPEVAAADVVDEVNRARAAIEVFALPLDQQLETGEIIARHGLMIATGQIPDVARLDPESHNKRQREAAPEPDPAHP